MHLDAPAQVDPGADLAYRGVEDLERVIAPEPAPKMIDGPASSDDFDRSAGQHAAETYVGSQAGCHQIEVTVAEAIRKLLRRSKPEWVQPVVVQPV